jgi:hypothetical protein
MSRRRLAAQSKDHFIEVLHRGSSLKTGIIVPRRANRSVTKRDAASRVFSRASIEVDLDLRMPEQMRIHLQPSVPQGRAAELLTERAAGLYAMIPTRKQFALSHCGRQAGQVPVTIFLDQVARFARQRDIDDPAIFYLMLIKKRGAVSSRTKLGFCRTQGSADCGDELAPSTKSRSPPPSAREARCAVIASLNRLPSSDAAAAR